LKFFFFEAITRGLVEAKEFGETVYRRYAQNDQDLLRNQTYYRLYHKLYSIDNDKYDRTVQTFALGMFRFRESISGDWAPIPVRKFKNDDYVKVNQSFNCDKLYNLIQFIYFKKVIVDKCPRIEEIWEKTQEEDEEYLKAKEDQKVVYYSPNRTLTNYFIHKNYLILGYY
jgi:hypothetical protein